MKLAHLLRLYRTLRYLKWQQLWYLIKYRYFQQLHKVPAGYTALAALPKRRDSNRVDTRRFDDQFSFLNQPHDFGSIEEIDWNFAGFGKLWTYNLNYFDFIRSTPPPHSCKKTSGIAQLLIDDWIAKATSHQDGHEPYPTSLRIMNWLGFYAEQGLTPPDQVITVIRIQYLDLWNKLEYHLRGNHLLENAIALVRAACYFNDQQRLPKAIKLLQIELDEQYRPEGAHYELSGAYHCTLLGRLLELYAALREWKPGEATLNTHLATLLVILQKSLKKQLGWLNYLTDDEGYYPHFNDSADGIAPSPKYLLQLGSKLDLSPQQISQHSLPAHVHHRFGAFEFWADLGPIGPDYIPGHGHADSLTFCLNYDGLAVVVDPSISTYEKNERRQLERSTRFHNTVSYADQDSSEVWGGFRCGRRAKASIVENSTGRIITEHDGYQHLGHKHRRAFHWSEKGLSIQDSFSGKATAHLFFTPQIEVIREHDHHWRVGPLQLRIEGGQATMRNYQFAHGFNHLTPAKSLHITFTGSLTMQFSEPA